MSTYRLALSLVLTFALTMPLFAEPSSQGAPAKSDESFRFDAGFTFSRFEQQVKSDIGDQSGERLVETFELSFVTMGTYNIWEFFSAGIYTRFDMGNRETARFAGFDSSGQTVVASELGGSYWELWLGPIVRAQYRQVFFELGHGTFTTRKDEGRPDLPAANGRTDGAFKTTPGVSWVFAIGGEFDITQRLSLVLRMEYRIRYYTSRDGRNIQNDLVHGTQNYSPFVGVAWRL